MKCQVSLAKLGLLPSRPVRALWIEIELLAHVAIKFHVEAREGLVD